MARRRTLDLLRPVRDGAEPRGQVLRRPLRTRIECLEQILRAFNDIADRDDIHQASNRLALVQQWIEHEAERAAADAVFLDLRLV